MNHWIFSMDIWIYLGYIWMFHCIYLDVTKKNGGIVMGRHPKYVKICCLMNHKSVVIFQVISTDKAWKQMAYIWIFHGI